MWKLGTILDFQKNQAVNLGLHNSATAPSSPVAGQVYYNTADTVAYYYNGTEWIPMSGSLGIDGKESVRVATTANITLSGTQTIDGVAVSAGDRVLVKDQSTASENGIYVVDSGAWSRSSDADTWDELISAFTFVEEGTTNADTGWLCTVNQGGTLGTSNVTWVQFSSPGVIQAGAGLTKTVNTIDFVAGDNSLTVNADDVTVNVDGVTIEVDATAGIRIKDGGVTFAKIASSVWGTTIDTTGNVVNVKDYTPVSGAIVARKVTFASTALSSTATTLTHNLNTQDIVLEATDSTSNEVIIVDWIVNSTDPNNKIDVTASPSVTVDITVIG